MADAEGGLVMHPFLRLSFVAIAILATALPAHALRITEFMALNTTMATDFVEEVLSTAKDSELCSPGRVTLP
jgi:hypothetical protein